MAQRNKNIIAKTNSTVMVNSLTKTKTIGQLCKYAATQIGEIVEIPSFVGNADRLQFPNIENKFVLLPIHLSQMKELMGTQIRKPIGNFVFGLLYANGTQHSHTDINLTHMRIVCLSLEEKSRREI